MSAKRLPFGAGEGRKLAEAAGRLRGVDYLKAICQGSILWSLGDLGAQGITYHHQARMARQEEEAARRQQERNQQSDGTKVVESAAPKKRKMPPFGVMYAAWDGWQTAKAACFAAFLYAPTATRWYWGLNRVFPAVPRLTTALVLKRVASDQLIFGPGVIIIYTVYQCMMAEGWDGATGAFLHRLRTTFSSTLMMNWMVWCPVQFFNFFVLPPRYWFLTVNAVAVPWTCFLAYTNTQAMEAHAVEVEARKQIDANEQKMRDYVAKKHSLLNEGKILK